MRERPNAYVYPCHDPAQDGPDTLRAAAWSVDLEWGRDDEEPTAPLVPVSPTTENIQRVLHDSWGAR